MPVLPLLVPEWLPLSQTLLTTAELTMLSICMGCQVSHMHARLQTVVAADQVSILVCLVLMQVKRQLALMKRAVVVTGGAEKGRATLTIPYLHPLRSLRESTSTDVQMCCCCLQDH
jgi:hypothetical protein